jgi:hypothetical protein
MGTFNEAKKNLMKSHSLPVSSLELGYNLNIELSLLGKAL